MSHHVPTCSRAEASWIEQILGAPWLTQEIPVAPNSSLLQGEERDTPPVTLSRPSVN